MLGVQSGNESADNLAMPGSPTLSDLVSVADDEARRLGQRYVGTEHLLLAALRDGAVARRLESHVGDHRLVRGNLTRAALDLGEGGRWDSAGGDHTWCELADDLDGTTAVSGQRELAELILDRTVRLEPVVGFVAGVRSGRDTTTVTHGWEALTRRVLITPHTGLLIGSVTKPLVALGILRLVADGSLELGQPITSCVSGIEFVVPPAKAPTLLEILTHTGGMPAGRGFRSYEDRPPSFNDAVGPVALDQPRGRWSYSNIGYWLLGEVISTVTSVPWDSWLSEHVTAPLQMEQTRSAPLPQLPVKGHSIVGASVHTVRASHVVAAPAGGLSSSANDLLRLGEGVGDPSCFGLLPEPLAALLRSPLISVPGETAAQAVAFRVLARPDGVIVHHSGDWPGFHAALSADIRARRVVALMANTDTLCLASLSLELVAGPRPDT